MEKKSLFMKDTNFFLSSESALADCLLATVLMVLFKSVAVKVKSVCQCWPMWLHYKIENKKTGPRKIALVEQRFFCWRIFPKFLPEKYDLDL
jgi:hypothetical protein